MNWMTISWSMMASASIVIGMMHLLIWRRNTSRDYYIYSSIMAVSAGVLTLTELALAQSVSLSALPAILRLGNVSVGATLVAMTWFLHRYLGSGRRFLLLTITGLWSCGLVVNFLSPWSLTFAEVTGLQEMTTFWGDKYHLVIGQGNPWKLLADAASLLVAVFAVDTSIQAWRSGKKRQAAVTGGAITFFIIAAGIHTPLVDAGIVKTPYLISVAFVAIVVALNYELVRNVSLTLDRAREIEAGQRRWNSLLTNVQLAVLDLDQAGIIRYANPFFLETTGFEAKAILGRHVSEVIPAGLHPEFSERLQQGLAGAPRPSSRWPIRSTTGENRTFDWSTVGLRAVDGSPDGLLTIGADVTPQIKVQGELDQTRRDLDRVSRANILGEFVSAIAHELNQPLTAVLANAQVARRYLDSTPPGIADTREMLDLIIRDDKRAAEIIRRLHSLVARGKVQREPLDLNALIRETVDLCDREIRYRGIIVTLDLEAELSPILAGRVEVQQVVLNLLFNALQALEALEQVEKENRRIRMATRSANGKVSFTIEDTGKGLTKSVRDNLFTPFGRGESGGIGLGLTICLRIIEAHGGSIRAEHVARGGARFVVDLPLSTHTEDQGNG